MPKNNKKAEIIFLTIVVIFSIILRVYNLNEVSASDDSQFGELIRLAVNDTRSAFYNHFPDEPIYMRDFKYTRPATVLPLLVSTKMLGYTPIGLLMPTILSTCLSIILLFYLCKQIFNLKIAYLSTILFATSPFHLLFSRNAMLHAQLTFLWLLTAALVYLAVKKDRPTYIYLAGATLLLNHFTTDFRGMVPLVGLIPAYFLGKKLRKFTKHIIITISLTAIITAGYYLLPFIIWKDPDYFMWLINGFLQGAGGASSVTTPQPIAEVLRANIGMLIFTPFLGIILIPFLYGLVNMIKRWKKPIAASLLVSLAGIAAFLFSRQIFFERLVIFTPIFATIAAVGIYQASKNETAINIYSVMIIYWSAIPFLLRTFLPQEASRLSGIAILPLISNIYFVLFVCLLTIIMRAIVLNSSMMKQLSTILGIIIILIIIAVPCALVMLKVGEFDRPKGAYAIGQYINNHPGDEKFACISESYGQAIMYYTGRLCMIWGPTDESTIRQTIEDGQLAYLVVDTVYVSKDEFRKKHEELYDRIIENGQDVTDDIPGTIDKRFRVIRISKQITSLQ